MEKKEKLVIGIVGEKGGGKETVGNILIELLSPKRVIRVRSSDILRETLIQWDIPLTRHNQQHVAIVMNEGFGLGTLSKAVRKRIDVLDADIVLFDGIRWESDAELLHAFTHHKLIYVTADAKTRYERSVRRNEKADESSVTFQQFMQEELARTETNIPTIGKTADYTIINEQGPGELKEEIRKIIPTLIG